jgi:hypothetical protein
MDGGPVGAAVRPGDFSGIDELQVVAVAVPE